MNATAYKTYTKVRVYTHALAYYTRKMKGWKHVNRTVKPYYEGFPFADPHTPEHVWLRVPLEDGEVRTLAIPRTSIIRIEELSDDI